MSCVWAGTFRAGFNGDDLPLTESKMYWPVDVTFTDAGDPYVLDWNAAGTEPWRTQVDGDVEALSVAADGIIYDAGVANDPPKTDALVFAVTS